MKPAAPLHVVLVGPLPPPFGGMANQTRQLAELLRGEDVVVDVVATNAPYRPAWAGRIPVVRALFRLLPYICSLRRVTRHGRVVHVMANSGWSWHLFAAPAVLVAVSRGVPVIVNYRGGEAEAFMHKQSRWVLPVLRRASALAVPSGFLEGIFARHGLDPVVVPNIVDLDRFDAHAGERPDLRDGPHLVVTRNLEALYDNATALRAFALVRARWPNARLSVAGSGPELDALRAEARRLGVAAAVTFTGRLDRDAMAHLYASAHVMLNPSRVDNTPNTILEAWASGVAVVSTDAGGVPFLVDANVNAVLVPPGDPQAMADAVLALLADPARTARLAAAGRRAAQRFAWPQVRPRWLELYRKLAGAPVRIGTIEATR